MNDACSRNTNVIYLVSYWPPGKVEDFDICSCYSKSAEDWCLILTPIRWPDQYYAFKVANIDHAFRYGYVYVVLNLCVNGQLSGGARHICTKFPANSRRSDRVWSVLSPPTRGMFGWYVSTSLHASLWEWLVRCANKWCSRLVWSRLKRRSPEHPKCCYIGNLAGEPLQGHTCCDGRVSGIENIPI